MTPVSKWILEIQDIIWSDVEYSDRTWERISPILHRVDNLLKQSVIEIDDENLYDNIMREIKEKI